MNNSDFKQLISKVSSTPAAAPPSTSVSAIAEEHSRSGLKPIKVKSTRGSALYLARKAAKELNEQPSETVPYRDRAAERRKAADSEQEAQERLAASMDYETSKFMGGDLAHTHLVKGLDFALLHKIRAGLNHSSAADQSAAAVGRPSDVAPLPLTSKSKVEVGTPCNTAVGAAIYRGTQQAALLYHSVAEAPSITSVDHFSAGRTVYEIQLAQRPSEADMFTLIMRGKAETLLTDPDSAAVICTMEPTTLQTVSLALTRRGQGGNADMNLVNMMPADSAGFVGENVAELGVAGVEEDIFAGAGIYAGHGLANTPLKGTDVDVSTAMGNDSGDSPIVGPVAHTGPIDYSAYYQPVDDAPTKAPPIRAVVQRPSKSSGFTLPPSADADYENPLVVRQQFDTVVHDEDEIGRMPNGAADEEGQDQSDDELDALLEGKHATSSNVPINIDRDKDIQALRTGKLDMLGGDKPRRSKTQGSSEGDAGAPEAFASRKGSWLKSLRESADDGGSKQRKKAKLGSQLGRIQQLIAEKKVGTISSFEKQVEGKMMGRIGK